jgi:hypothetical protein
MFDSIKQMILVRRFLARTHGRIFSVTFKTVDGQWRTMNCKVLRTPSLFRPTYVVLENNILHKTGAPKASIRSFRATNVLTMKCGETMYINSRVA